MTPGVTLSSPDLRPSLLSIVDALLAEGLLDAFATSALIDNSRVSHRIASALVPPLRARHRRLPEHLRGRAHSMMWAELLRAAVNRFSPRLGHKFWWRNETAFDRRVAEHFAGRSAVLCGMEHASLASFEAQKRLGGTTVLRQVMAHATEADAVWRDAEQRAPNAFHGRAWLLRDLERTRVRKFSEYELSDRILANSDFVRDSFVRQGFDAGRVVAIPTGCPPIADVSARAGRGNAPLRFLFVGGLGFRKGADVLLEAWKRVPKAHAQLVFAGGIVDAPLAASAVAAGAEVLGHLDALRLDEAFRSADVFVLPSRLEGLAHSLLEALSYGLPVIATPETGAGRFVVAGRNGWVVPGENSAALSAAMAEAIDRRTLLQEMSNASLAQASSWTRAHATAATIAFFRSLT